MVRRRCRLHDISNLADDLRMLCRYVSLFTNVLGQVVELIQFSPDDRYLFRGTADGSIRFADFESGTDKVWTGPAGGVFSVAFSEDGRTCATTDASQKQKIRLWDTETGERYGVFDNPIGSAGDLGTKSGAEVFLLDNKLILCGVHLPHSKIAIWDLSR